MLLHCTFLRHAEAGSARSDHARDLTPLGMANCAGLATRMKSANYRPDLILASDALRTKTTVELLNLGAVVLTPELYLASADQLGSVMCGLSWAKHVLIVAHNPGLSDFLEQYSRPEYPLLPGSGFQLVWDIEDWALTRVESPCEVHQFSPEVGLWPSSSEN